jgi:integrase
MALRFIAMTGCRGREAKLVRKEDLYLDDDHPLIRIPTLKRKTRPVRSVFVFDDWFAKELKRFAKGVPAGEVLFDVSMRTLQYRNEQILTHLALRAAKDGCLHLFRHTRASQLAAMGFSPQEIAQQLGWSGIQMSMRYTHSDVKSMFARYRNLPDGRGRKKR